MLAPGRCQRLDHYDYKGLRIGTTSRMRNARPMGHMVGTSPAGVAAW
jgi:hypothetical protein